MAENMFMTENLSGKYRVATEKKVRPSKNKFYFCVYLLSSDPLYFL